MRSKSVSRGEGIRGQPAVVGRQEARVSRKRSRSGRIKPAQAGAEDDKRKGGSRDKDAVRRRGRRKR